MGIWETFTDLVDAATPWSTAEAEAPPAEEQQQVRHDATPDRSPRRPRPRPHPTSMRSSLRPSTRAVAIEPWGRAGAAGGRAGRGACHGDVS